jgi:hypothetical protein
MDFLAWHPIFSAEGCGFDVTPSNIAFLPEDAAATVAACLRELGCPPAHSFDTRAFCSPYFGRPDAEDWTERYERAWHIEVRFAHPTDGERKLRLAPVEINVPGLTDPVLGVVRPQLESQVIAHFEGDVDRVRLTAAMGALPYSLHTLHPRVHQLRVALGEVKLPEEEAQVKKVMGRCRELGGRVNWRDAMPIDARWGGC